MNYMKNWQFKIQAISIKYIITVLIIIAFSTIITIFGLVELLRYIHYCFEIFIKLSVICYPLLIVLCIMPLIVYHPVYALLLLIGVFLDTAILLLILRIQFLSIIYIIIYIGAIAILFLFVLMMFNLKNLHNPIQMKYFQWLRSFFIFGFLGVMIYTLIKLRIIQSYNNLFFWYVYEKWDDIKHYLTFFYSDILIFSHLFYTYYSYFFLLSGLLLFIAMIGSIVLASGITEKTLNKYEPQEYLKYYIYTWENLKSLWK